MFCPNCGTQTASNANFCQSCGKRVAPEVASESIATATPSPHQIVDTQQGTGLLQDPKSYLHKPTANTEFRNKLLDEFIACTTSKGLSEWLQDIGQDCSGTAEEKEARIRQHTKYVSMPAEEFPTQTLSYLDGVRKRKLLPELCEALALDPEGSPEELIRRVYREVGFKEGWITRFQKGMPISKGNVAPFVEWHPILSSYEYEKDAYPDFVNEMVEVFGPDNVHEQHAIAHGTTLRIDFHIGHPLQGGVGVEFKMPTTVAEIQRALGQIDQYISRYRNDLIVVAFTDFLDDAQTILFLEGLAQKGVFAVARESD